MNNEEQNFLNELEKKLWTAPDKLRSTLDAALQKLYTNITAPLFKAFKQNKFQSENLSTLRDTLLPKLLSGEIELQANQKGLVNG